MGSKLGENYNQNGISEAITQIILFHMLIHTQNDRTPKKYPFIICKDQGVNKQL